MQISFDQSKNRYYLDCTFEERNIAKQYKFKWDIEENRWFTDNWYNAFIIQKRLREEIVDLPTGGKGYRSHASCSELQRFDMAFHNSFSNCSKFNLKDKTNELFSFQRQGVTEIVNRDSNILLADEQGLGKTAQAIVSIRNMNDPYVLVICPASLKINWQREFEVWLSDLQENEIQIIRKGKDIIDQSRRIIIVNYDLLKSRLTADQLKEYDADVVILDEAHYLKNGSALRTKAALKLAKAARKTIAITGTPVLNRPIELYPLLNAISPETIAPYNDYRRFAFRFCGAYQGKFGFNVDGAINLEELNTRLRATCMIRRLKKDVLDQLPDKMPSQIIAFEQDKDTKAIIKKEKTLDIEDLKKHPEKMNVGEVAKLRHELALAKLPKCIEYIEERLLSGNKIVIFAHHRDVIIQLANNFHNPKYKDGFCNHRKMIGGMSDYEKQEAIDTFQNNKQCKVFIGQIQAAGVGITLTAASDVIFVESSWTPGEIDQCIDRCHRIGQKSSVTSTFLTVENSIEETMLKVVFDKRKIINQILK